MTAAPDPVADPRPLAAAHGRGELANLDCLRTFAVLCVLVDHVTLALNTLYFHNHVLESLVARLGRLGVVAFFVHTSLVLMFSLERLERETPRPVLAFYLRRAFRIYPLSILTVILVTIFQIPDQPWTPSLPGRYSPLNVVSNLLLMHNFVGVTVTGPLWSLPYEVQMYMVLPVLYFVARRPESARVVFGVFGVAAVLGEAVHLITGKLHFAAFAPCFLCGILAYSLRNRLRPRFRGILWGFFVPALLVAAAALGVLWPKQEHVWGWLLSFTLGGSVYLFHDSTSALWNSFTKNVATYSYGLYLLHTPALYLVFGVLGVTGAFFGPALWIVLVCAGSYAMFHAVESPMIRYGKQVTRKVAGTLKARRAAG